MSPEQQSGLVLHRTRHLFIRQQTWVINAIRAHLAEFGITAPVAAKVSKRTLDRVAEKIGHVGDEELQDQRR
jgi:transposase